MYLQPPIQTGKRAPWRPVVWDAYVPCDESEWIQRHQEGVVACVGNVYVRHGGSSLEESTRYYKKEPSGRKQQVGVQV